MHKENIEKDHFMDVYHLNRVAAALSRNWTARTKVCRG